jgi:uncharacterized coiled-coil protein SlyX
MRVKPYVLVSAAVLVAGVGGGAAIAASGGDERQKTEQSILDDAAKRLNVTPEALRSALGAAEDAQLDQAVKDGKLTQEQADAIKKRRAEDKSVLGGPGVGGPGGHGRGGAGGPGLGLRFKAGPGGALDAAASALGLKREDLVSKLRDGKSIADVAKAEGKSVDDVKKAITDGVTKELDKAVTDKKLTSAQRDDTLKELTEHLDDLVNGKRPAGAPAGRGHWR